MFRKFRPPILRPIPCTAFALLLALLILLVPSVVTTAAAAAPPPASLDDTGAPPESVPVGGHIVGEKACYVRLPDLPAPRYGGFGAYNAQTRVLAFAGGAQKLADDNTLAHSDLWSIRLDDPGAAWQVVTANASAGYNRDRDRGCREMASVRVEDDLWLSVFGKDGCDNGRHSRKAKGGDIKALQVGVGDGGDVVRWLPNSGARMLEGVLDEEDGRLVRLFATWDDKRAQLLFGHGTFDSAHTSETRDELWAARRVGNQFQLRELRPREAVRGRSPGRRYGSCAAYVRDDEAGLDGVLLLGGRLESEVRADLWWLDLDAARDGVWRDWTARVANRADFGGRYEGACAYDPASRAFYSWTGRVDGDIPDGAKRSAGVWRLPLETAADPEAVLRWERLSPDDQVGITGRRLAPSVWDPQDRRLFVIGGRNRLDALADVWAIYPDVEAESCATLDPFAPRAQEPPAGAPDPAPSPPPPTAEPSEPAPVPTALPPVPTAAPIPAPTVSPAPGWRLWLPRLLRSGGAS